MSGRIRTLKPEWLEDEKLASLSDAARLLSAGLVLLADDHGNGRAHELFVASRVWPYGDPHESLSKVSNGFTELEQSGFVRLYTVKGQRYFHIVNWSKHQKVQHPSKPRVPLPDEAESGQEDGGSGASPPPVTQSSGDPHESLTPDLRSPISDLRSPTGDHARAHEYPPEPEAENFYHDELANLFSELRQAAGGGSYGPTVPMAHWDHLNSAIQWARGQADRDGISVRDALARSISNWLASTTMEETKNWHPKFWTDPGSWYAVKPPGSAVEDWDAERERRNAEHRRQMGLS